MPTRRAWRRATTQRSACAAEAGGSRAGGRRGGRRPRGGARRLLGARRGEALGKPRAADLSRELTAELRRLRDVQAAEAAFGGREPSPLVFPSKEGTYLDPGNLMHRVWNPLLRAAGLRHRGMHQLRHSFATILLAEGAPITYVAQQLDHASPRITLEIYAHWIPTSDRSIVDRLDGPNATAICKPRATENTKADHSDPAMIGLSTCP